MNDANSTPADPYAYLMALTDAEGYEILPDIDGNWRDEAGLAAAARWVRIPDQGDLVL